MNVKSSEKDVETALGTFKVDQGAALTTFEVGELHRLG
jgi:hypothetical protein